MCYVLRALATPSLVLTGGMAVQGMPYLDIIKLLKDNTNLPISAYHVSGTVPPSVLRCRGVAGSCLVLLRRSMG